jgi:tRNA/tmRNA/rRNA uracil-C5-methylase (TrmA/RlmC/RlmD family)
VKKIIYIFLIIFSFSFISCNNSKNNSNEENKEFAKISKDTIILMLIDIHIADSYVSINPLGSKNKIKAKDFYYSIFEKYNYSKETFQKNIDFYSNNPKELDKMYEEVLNKLKSKNVNLVPNE